MNSYRNPSPSRAAVTQRGVVSRASTARAQVASNQSDRASRLLAGFLATGVLLSLISLLLLR